VKANCQISLIHMTSKNIDLCHCSECYFRLWLHKKWPSNKRKEISRSANSGFVKQKQGEAPGFMSNKKNSL